ncbi:MAG: RnfABCDGE type electron transport complex subunit B [Burkholderiales bacterium]
MTPDIDAVDALLPQTQCGLCGHAGCRPYAEAIANGDAAINRCPPGGDELIAEIAALLGVGTLPLDTACGTIMPPATAFIDEAACIGCTLCISACPVDAIVGASRRMHTVIAGECTGCALCLPPCPVDCITLAPTGAPRDRAEQRAASLHLKKRHESHLQRLRERQEKKRAQRAAAGAITRKRETVARAVSRARARLAGGKR